MSTSNVELREALENCLTQMDQARPMFDDDPEFVEALENGRNTLAEAEREAAEESARQKAANLALLPPIAYVDNTWDQSEGAARVVAIKRGEMGFHPIATSRSADDLNAMEGVTPAQAAAMHAGSMFGWHLPGANPAAHEKDDDSAVGYTYLKITPVVEDHDGKFWTTDTEEQARDHAKNVSGFVFYGIYAGIQGEEEEEHLIDRKDAKAAAETASRLLGREVEPAPCAQILPIRCAPLSPTIKKSARPAVPGF